MREVRLSIPFESMVNFKKRFTFKEEGWVLVLNRTDHNFLKEYKQIDPMNFCGELMVVWHTDMNSGRAVLTNMNKF